ncbi:MAG: hypothetical protein ACRBN8_13170 [Nannocystales bacterium]
MAWMLGVPFVVALGSVATQPALDDDGSADAEAGVVPEVGTATGTDADVSADADASADWQAASVDTGAEEDTSEETFEESGSSGVTGSLSTSTASDDELAPIATATVESGGGGIDPFDGRLGVGAIRTIAGLNGINLRYFVTDNFAIGGSAGVALFSYSENDPESTDPVCPDPECRLEDSRTVAFMAFNVEGLYFLHLGREAGALPFRADFGLGGRFGVMTSANASDVSNNLDDPTELHIEIPLVFQLMFGNNFALSPELGMDFRIIPGSREDGDSNPGVTGTGVGGFGAVAGPGFGWDLTPGVGLFGGASMHYYF